jgi:hypothetical protein
LTEVSDRGTAIFEHGRAPPGVAAVLRWELAMEFEIELSGPVPDLGAVEEAIRAVDPAALVASGAGGHSLRLAAALSVTELMALLKQAGCPVAAYQIVQLPSVCCGGCSG